MLLFLYAFTSLSLNLYQLLKRGILGTHNAEIDFTVKLPPKDVLIKFGSAQLEVRPSLSAFLF